MEYNEIRNKLLDSIRTNDLYLVDKIVHQESLDLASPHFQGHTLLYHAITWRHFQIVDWLLSHNCPVNSSVSNKPSWYSTLHLAVYHKYNELINNLLERGADVTARNPNGDTPLYVACIVGNVEAVKLLLCKDKSIVNLPDNTLHTPLHVAVEAGYLEIVLLLLKNGAYVNVRTVKSDCIGCTPLHLAIMTKNWAVTRALLLHGADANKRINLPNKFIYKFSNIVNYDFTPLHLAVQVDNEKIIDLLLYHKANVNASIKETGMTPLHFAVLMQRKKAVILFSNTDANFLAITKEGKNIFHLAIESEWIDLLKVLLYKNANIDETTKDGDTALHLAVRLGNLFIVNFLIDNNANINLKNVMGQTPLHLAIESHLEIVKTLLERGASIDEINYKNETSLTLAVKSGDLKTVSLILNYRPSIHNNINKSAVMYAVQKFEELGEIIILLLDYGFELPNDKNYSKTFDDKKIEFFKCPTFVNMHRKLLDATIKYNNSKLLDLILSNSLKIQESQILAAAKFQDMTMIKVFLKHKIDVNICDEYGTTLLHFAVWHKQLEFIDFLITENKVNVNNTKIIENNDFYEHIVTSPLHIAVTKKRYNIVLALLNYNADVNYKNGQNATVLHHATKNASSLNIIKTLLRYGADINIFDGCHKLPVYYIFHQTCICNLVFRSYYDLDDEDCECYIDENFEEDIMNELVKIYVKHIVYLSSINKFVHSDNIIILSQYKNFDNLQILCATEITKMKKERFYDNLTYYDLLIKKSNALAAYGRNHELIKVLEAKDYEKIFPLYSEDLKEQIDEAQRRASLLESSASILMKLTNLNIPHVVLHNIFDYLSTKELNNLSLA